MRVTGVGVDWGPQTLIHRIAGFLQYPPHKNARDRKGKEKCRTIAEDYDVAFVVPNISLNPNHFPFTKFHKS